MTKPASMIKIQPISLTLTQFENIKACLSVLDWSVFLDSSDKEHIDSHWSIVSAQPIATLQSIAGVTTFCHGDVCQQSKLDPFSLLQEKRALLFQQQTTSEEVPFSSGVLGSIDYELGYQFESIRHSEKPQGLMLPEMSLGFYDWSLLYNHKTGNFYLTIYHDSSNEQSLCQQWQARLLWLMAQAETQCNAAPFSLQGDWLANMDKQQYSEKFDRVQQYILSGDCYQVNLAQRFKAPYRGNEYQAYQALLAENSPPFAAFLRLPKQVILSLSPERFLKLVDEVVETKPIKGTRPRFHDVNKDDESQQQLLHSEKDRSENLMIVDLLRNDIGRVCQAGSVKVPKLFEIESFPAVHHLVSTVIGKLDKQYRVEDLLRACFPGGSITGAPKIRSMEIIAELEPNRRQSYCGSIGYLCNSGKMDMNIAIRTLICFEGNIYCWAGGGLVADSEVESEYQECFDKLSKILPCLAQLNSD